MCGIDIDGYCDCMLLHKAHLYRLYPTEAQAQKLSRWLGAVRCVYNLALEQRRDWYRPGRRFNFASQCREVTALRAEVDWLREAPIHPLQQAIRDLDRAYANFFAGRKGYPTPRKRGLNDSMRFPDPAGFEFRRLSRHWGEVKLPKLGWVRFRWDRDVPGTPKNITIKRRAGVWTAAVQYEREIEDPAPSTLPAVGIDRGVAVFAALSDGTKVAAVNHGRKAARALCRAQRSLARKKRGSNNRRKQARRVARLHARVTRRRNDFLQKQSTIIAKNHGMVVLEKLKIDNMSRSAKGTCELPGRNVRQKAGLNRSILDQGWHGFKAMLDYKLAERGGRLVEVAPHYTSQTCSACGAVDRASRVSQSRFACTACGYAANADENAAINILRRADGPVLPAEGHRSQRSDEAGTNWRAA